MNLFVEIVYNNKISMSGAFRNGGTYDIMLYLIKKKPRYRPLKIAFLRTYNSGTNWPTGPKFCMNGLLGNFYRISECCLFRGVLNGFLKTLGANFWNY